METHDINKVKINSLVVSLFWIVKHYVLVQRVENGLVQAQIIFITFILFFNNLFVIKIVIIVISIAKEIVINFFNLILNISKIMLIIDTGLIGINLISLHKT